MGITWLIVEVELGHHPVALSLNKLRLPQYQGYYIRMSRLETASVEERIERYRSLSYLQFLVMPSLLTDYVRCLIACGMKSLIHQLFRMLIETLYEFVPELMHHTDTKSSFHTPLKRKLYQLILVIAVEGGFNEDFWNKYIPMNFFKLFIPDLMPYYSTPEHCLFLKSLLSYFELKTVFEQIAEGSAKTVLDQFTEEKLPRIQEDLLAIETLHDSVYGKYKKEFLRSYSKVNFVLKGDKNVPVSTNEEEAPAAEDIQLLPEVLSRRNTLEYEKNVNKYYLLCRTMKEKSMFLDRIMTNLTEGVSSVKVQQARILNQLFMEEFQDSKEFDPIRGNLFCNLVTVSCLEQCYHGSKSVGEILGDAVLIYKQVSEISKPSISKVSPLIYSLLFVANLAHPESNQVSKQVFEKLYEFLGEILVQYQDEKRNPEYIKIVLVALLLEIQLAKTKSKEKIEQFWEKLNGHQDLILSLNSWELLNNVISIWILKNWKSKAQLLSYFAKYEKIESVLRQLFLKKENLGFPLESTSSPEKGDIIQLAIKKKKLLFREVQQIENGQLSCKKRQTMLQELSYYFLRGKHEKAMINCLSLLQATIQQMTDLTVEFQIFIDSLLAILFVCLQEMGRLFEACIAADLFPGEPNYEESQKLVQGLKKQRFKGEYFECIFNYDTVDLLASAYPEAREMILGWIENQENYQWMTDTKRKKIKISKIKRLTTLILECQDPK